MNVRHCPHCHEILGEAVGVCGQCGASFSPEVVESDHSWGEESNVITVRALPKTEFPIASNKPARFAILHNFLQRPVVLFRQKITGPSTPQSWSNARPELITSTLFPDSHDGRAEPDDGEAETVVLHQATWQKVVETPRSYPAVMYRPRPAQRTLSLLTWYKTSLQRFMPPVTLFWISIIILLICVGGGVFGISSSSGHGVPSTLKAAGSLSLQVTPHEAAVGSLITLRGNNFKARDHVGLTRDASIAIIDTNNVAIITTNSQGAFTDAVYVGADWGNGSHTINAEEASTHKIVSFPILVSGDSSSLRPGHLALSVSQLDFGAGDQATNSTKMITLTNLGDGEISWQGTASQSWLMLSPQSGKFSSKTQIAVTIAVNRSNAQPGSYSGQLSFASSAGQFILPVKMQVTQLQADHEAVLQVSPAVLSFTATDGGAKPAAQTITVSNPGVQSLQWGVKSDASWLSTTPRSNSIDAGNSDAVTVNADTTMMLPGTYSGTLTFSSQGSATVMHSPQSVYISVTIVPQCSLQVTPGMVTFASAYQQEAPASKSITLANSTDCATSTAMAWSATSNADWLRLDRSQGNTPDTVTISIVPGNLKPGSYSGAVTFNTASGVQVLLVNFVLGPASEPVLAVGSAALSFTTIVSEGSPGSETATLTNSGGGTLLWQATATTTTGGDWLSVSPAAGSLGADQSLALTISTHSVDTLKPDVYSGMINITGTDTAGIAVAGAAQNVPVNLVVKPACTLTVSPGTLAFTAVAGQTASVPQKLTLTAAGTCNNTLNWKASLGTDPAGGNWLTATPGGSVTLGTSTSMSVDVAFAGLTNGIYHGSVSVSAVDSVTQAAIATSPAVTVNVEAQPPCTLQASVPKAENFTTEVGASSVQSGSFSVGVTGTCSGSITVTPVVTLDTGSGWLTAMSGRASTATVSSGGTATFQTSVNGVSLAANTYTGKITLTATNNGVEIAGSGQEISVTLTVDGAPVVTANPASMIFNMKSEKLTQPFSIGNTGGAPVDWSVSLAPGTPAWITLLPTGTISGTNLQGGTNTAPMTLQVDASNIAGPATQVVYIQINATDPLAGGASLKAIAPIQVTVNIAAPAMQVSGTSLSFVTTSGSSAGTQALTITNAGGNTLTWSVAGVGGASLPAWLKVEQTAGSDASNTSSTVTFSVDTTSLSSSPPDATIVITPTIGTPVSITVSLTIIPVTITTTPPTISPLVQPPESVVGTSTAAP